MKRMQHCFNCGEELGIYDSYHDDSEHCGKIECQRAANDEYRQRDADAFESAREDNFDRYR